MSRPVNKNRPIELQNAIVKYLVKRGLADLSLRPLAKAVRCSPRVLLYHFGSKEHMVTEALAQVRRVQRATYDRIEATGFEQSYRAVWKRMAAPDSEPMFRLFFETYGAALRQPRLYKDFLRETIDHWLQAITDDLCREGYRRKEACALATIILAGLRGFMLDFCATHDRTRLDHSVQLWLRMLASTLTSRKQPSVTK
jgi:AcrR family transcriptional regulator